MTICTQCGQENTDAARFCNACAAPLVAPTGVGSQRRKTVTVLFCDLAGSTALGEELDAEALRIVLARYFERMKLIVERHGGTVEKFIGDAVMAVFGVPAAHEDDALRAVRSAVEMRDAMPELGLRGRIGVMTGEVVTGTEERLATGDAVNVASRLESAAAAGEVLLGEATLALVRAAVEVEAVAPLELKGKARPVSAYRLVRVREAPERRHDAPFVARERELAYLREAWERVRAEQRCELVTVVGEAGVGKSRLVAEALAVVEATVARGRCLPYGEGVTYSPIAEVLKQLDERPAEDTAAAAIRSLLGESEVPTSAEEIAWAFRKTIEQVAEERPLVVVFDDIQWGEETFLDLIEHVALLSTGAPILLLCIARPDIGERRPAWPVALRLEPLRDEAVDQLIGERIPGELHERIARAAGGNPLFIEEMLAMAGDSEGAVIVPPTLQALLAARLDQLGTAERSVLERGAIEGEVFHRRAVQALAPDEAQVTPRLATLVRKQLIRPYRSQLAGDDGFRFRHLLIRDAAYRALPKATRAELHRHFAGWLEHHGAELVELDEILGYHLEQACRYRAELGMPRDDDLATAARHRLTAAGRRARARSDDAAAANLLERAAALVPPPRLDLSLETELVDAMFDAGRGSDALRRAESLGERAAAVGNHVGELCGRVQAGVIGMSLEPEGAAERLAALVDTAWPVLLAAGDDVALYTAYHAVAEVAYQHGELDAALEAYERAAGHARKAGLAQEFLEWRASCRFYGTTPVPEILAWLEEHESRAGRNHWLRMYRALALALVGRFDEARPILAKARAELTERDPGLRLAVMIGIESVDFELLAGDPAAAAELGTEGCRLLEESGDKSFLSTAAGCLAKALYALDRLDEADAWATKAADLGSSEDVFTQLLWHQVKAKVCARRGEHAEAERIAREAVAIIGKTTVLNGQADASADLAEVLELAGRREEGAAERATALRLYEQKGNVVDGDRIRERLSAPA